MFRRYRDKSHANVNDFSLRDLRAKGNTLNLST